MAEQKAWRVEYWTISGVHTGYRVVRGAGLGLAIAEAFTGDRYTPGSFREAQAKADELCETLNRELV